MLPLLAALTVACSGDVADPTFVLGAGVLIDTTANHALDAEVTWGGDIVGVTSVEASDTSWSGAVEVELAEGDTADVRCGREPCSRAWSGTMTLDDVVLHHGGRAAEDDAGFDCVYEGLGDDVCDSAAGFDFDPPDVRLDGVLDLALGWRDAGYPGNVLSVWQITTTGPSALRARGLAMDRTAALTLTYEAAWDEFSGHVVVRGTVDGAASGYDFGWTD